MQSYGSESSVCAIRNWSVVTEGFTAKMAEAANGAANGGSGVRTTAVSLSEIDEDTRFASLLKAYGIQTEAKIGYGDRGRGLFSTTHIRAGDPALSVPMQLCLFHRMNAKDSGVQLDNHPSGALTDEDRKRLTWASEMWLTVELMKLLEEAAGVGQGFWCEYWWILPPPSCRLPINLPRSALEQRGSTCCLST